MTGDGMPGTTLTFAVANAPAGAPTVVLAGFGGPGMVQIPGLDLGIAPPFIPLGGGLADATGAFSTSVAIPATMTRFLEADAQALSIQINFQPPVPGGPRGGIGSLFSFCESDVEHFTAGTPPTP